MECGREEEPDCPVFVVAMAKTNGQERSAIQTGEESARMAPSFPIRGATKIEGGFLPVPTPWTSGGTSGCRTNRVESENAILLARNAS